MPIRYAKSIEVDRCRINRICSTQDWMLPLNRYLRFKVQCWMCRKCFLNIMHLPPKHCCGTNQMIWWWCNDGKWKKRILSLLLCYLMSRCFSIRLNPNTKGAKRSNLIAYRIVSRVCRCRYVFNGAHVPLLMILFILTFNRNELTNDITALAIQLAMKHKALEWKKMKKKPFCYFTISKLLCQPFIVS